MKTLLITLYCLLSLGFAVLVFLACFSEYGRLSEHLFLGGAMFAGALSVPCFVAALLIKG